MLLLQYDGILLLFIKNVSCSKSHKKRNSENLRKIRRRTFIFYMKANFVKQHFFLFYSV